MLVIDADRHGGPDGVAAWQSLIAAHGVPGAACVTTPSGGQHIYFRNFDPPHGNAEGDLPEGINVRGVGGYVIAPDTIMPDGRIYELDGDPSSAPPIPDWLDVLLNGAEKPAAASPGRVQPGGVMGDARIRAYSEAAIERELARVREAMPGSWNNTLNEAAFALGQMVGAGWIGESEASNWLLAASLHARPKKRVEAMRTIRSGFEAGMKEPRQLPDDGSHAESLVGAEIVRKLIESAKQRRGKEHENPDEFVLEEVFMIETPASLIRNLLPRNGLVIDGGQSGAAKSYCEIDMCLALASGQNWFGQPVRERVGVVYIAAEGQSTIERRFIAAKRARGVTSVLPIARTRKSNFDLRDQRERALLIRSMGKVDQRFRDQHGVRLGVIVVDTVSSSCPMKDENSNAEIAKVCRELRQIADDTDTVVIGVHHFGKNADTGLRGGSAWRANCDHSRIFLADREAAGDIAKNRRMILEKNRVGPEGEVYGFELQATSFGLDQYNDEIVECHVERTISTKTLKVSEAERHLQNAFVAASLSYQHPIETPRPHLAAVPLLNVREEFITRWATGEEALSREQRSAARSAWHRTLNKARGQRYSVEKSEGCEWIWPHA